MLPAIYNIGISVLKERGFMQTERKIENAVKDKSNVPRAMPRQTRLRELTVFPKGDKISAEENKLYETKVKADTNQLFIRALPVPDKLLSRRTGLITEAPP